MWVVYTRYRIEINLDLVSIYSRLLHCLFLYIFRLAFHSCADASASALLPEEHQYENRSSDVQGSLPLTANSNEGASDYDLTHHNEHATDDDASHHFSDVGINLAERPPRFEDASGQANVTVQLGGTAFLNCKVLDLQDKTVFHLL